MFYIYKLIHAPTGSFYIGRTKNPARRLGQHLEKCWVVSTKLYEFMRTTSHKDWDIYLLSETDTLQDSVEKEAEQIRIHNAFIDGLNSQVNNQNPITHVMTPKEIASWSKKHLTRDFSKTKQKQSLAKQGNTNIAKKHADPQWKAQWLSRMHKLGKKVLCVTDGKVYMSVGEAAKFYGIGRCDLRRVCDNTRSHVKSLVFQWYTET